MDLDEYMSSTGIEVDDPETLRPEDADALLSRIAYFQAKKEANARLAGARIQRAVDWMESENAYPTDQIDAARLALEGWARLQNQYYPKKRSWSFPTGKLTLRKRTALIVETDRAALTKALTDGGYGHLVRTPDPVPLVGELKKIAGTTPMSDLETEGSPEDVDHFHVVLDGEILPGVHIDEPRTLKFDFKVGEDDAEG